MITVYGADWCEDTRRSRRQLRRLAVPHQYLNIDEDLDALDRAKALNAGRRRTPTIDLIDRVLVEPSNTTLAEALIQRGELTREEMVERVTVQNVGDLERAVRGGVGLLLVVLASRSPRRVRWPVRLLGASAALTGITGWCPGYSAAGISSLDGPGDRPSESARQAWIVSAPEPSQ